MSLSDQKIVKLIKKGSSKAYKLLNKQYFPMLKAYVMSNSGNDQDAWDLYQDTLLDLTDNVKKQDFELTCALKTYFTAIFQNKWLTRLRDKKKHFVEFDEEEHTEIDVTPHHEIEMAKFDLYLLYLEHFNRLSERCQKIWNKKFEGAKWEAIAEVIGTRSQSNVWKLTSECKSGLLDNIYNDPEYERLKKNYDELKNEF